VFKLTKRKNCLDKPLVFLDIPAPWEAVAAAKAAFKQDKMGKICTFSPCIEQISKTVTALNEHGFADIQMYECLIRFHELRVLPVLTIDEALEMERAAEKKRKRALPRVLRKELEGQQENSNDRDEEKSGQTYDDDDDSKGRGGASYKRRYDEKDSLFTLSSDEHCELSSVALNSTLSVECETGSSSLVQNHATPRDTIEARNMWTTRPPAEQRGHTSYLLFATFTPTVQRPCQTEINAAAKK